MFETGALRRIFWPKRKAGIGEWKVLYNEELNDLYSSANIIRLMKTRRMTWARHVGHIGRGEMHTRFWWGNMREREHLENVVADWTMILEWKLKKWVGRAWTGLIWLRLGTCGFLRER